MKNAVIGVLATLVILMGGYLVYDKVIDKEEKKENSVVEDNTKNESDTSEEKDFNLHEAKGLIDRYLSGMFNRASHSNSLLGDQINIDKYKIYFAIVNAKATKIDYTCEEAFPDILNNGRQLIVKSDDFWGTCNLNNTFRKQYTYADVNQSYKALFGNNSNAPKNNVSFDGIGTFAYSEKYDAYIELSCECGGIDFIQEIYGIKSAKLNGDKLIVNIGYSTYEPATDDPENASTYVLDTMNGEVEISKEEVTNKEALLNKYLDKFDTYEFEFFKEDDTYKLKNVTKK